MLSVVQTINGYLSDYVLIILLLAVGLWYSIKTGFVQIRCFKEGMGRVFGNLTLSGKKHESGMSSFQALATAIAAQVGTGNIVGASGAILTGGPGAIFWMWVIAFFGMATIYAEAVLAQKTRELLPDGQIQAAVPFQQQGVIGCQALAGHPVQFDATVPQDRFQFFNHRVPPRGCAAIAAWFPPVRPPAAGDRF